MVVYTVRARADGLTKRRVLDAISLTSTELGLHKVLEVQKLAHSHWHFKRATGTGTLELTWEHADNSFKVIVHKNRAGAGGWAAEQAPIFAHRLAIILDGQVLT